MDDPSDSRPILRSDSRPILHERPIHASDSSIESDAAESFASRLRECIGDETVSSFARRCGIPEATIRSYLDGRKPVFDKLVRMAQAAGVTLDWLATGRGPKRRTNAQHIENVASSSITHARRWEKIIALVEGIEDEQERAAFLEEIYARARQTAELAELRKAVRDLQTAIKKPA